MWTVEELDFDLNITAIVCISLSIGNLVGCILQLNFLSSHSVGGWILDLAIPNKIFRCDGLVKFLLVKAINILCSI